MARIIRRSKKGKHDKKEAEFYVPNQEHDYHTEFGTITKEQLEKGGRLTVGKEEVTILPAHFVDRYARLQRGAQIIQEKDLGLIIARTGLSKESVVLDIGAGSAFASILLARLVKEVHAYDIDEHSLKVSRRNVEEIGAKNVSVERGDAYSPETIKAKNIDLFLLDVPEPWRALETAKKVLKPGAFLVGYTPCITQAKRLVEELGSSFFHVDTVEIMEREWRIQGEAVRPESKDFQHTAFLSFIRRI